jgi:hypothetical protein
MHTAPFRTTPRKAALVLQLFWQIPHKGIGASYPVALGYPLKCGNSGFCVAVMQQNV